MVRTIEEGGGGLIGCSKLYKPYFGTGVLVPLENNSRNQLTRA